MSAAGALRAMIPAGHGVSAEVDVYRDGERVTVVGNARHTVRTPFGPVQTVARVMTVFPSIAAFKAAKARAFDLDPALYARVVGVLGVDDDPMHAPPLPADVAAMFRPRGALPPAPASAAREVPKLYAAREIKIA